MDYIELQCAIPNNTEDARDILAVELGELGYESFQEYENGILAYIRSDLFDNKIYSDIYCVKEEVFGKMEFTYQLYKDRNWNEYWEKNFQPVEINDRVIIKAPFHNVEKSFEYEIILEPKMSFGTGHHATTWLMIAQMLELDFVGKIVLDIGCGTGILSVFASMKGAAKVVGFDNNDWAFENALENIELNNISDVEILLGEIRTLNTIEKSDIVLANINRNVILEEMPKYVAKIAKPDGKILFSGILSENFPEIDACAKANGLKLEHKLIKDNWLMLQYYLAG